MAKIIQAREAKPGNAVRKLSDDEAFKLMRTQVRKLTDEEKAALEAWGSKGTNEAKPSNRSAANHTPVRKLSDDEAFKLMRTQVRKLTDEEKAALEAWGSTKNTLKEIEEPVDRTEKRLKPRFAFVQKQATEEKA